jgi:hypothetical protein
MRFYKFDRHWLLLVAAAIACSGALLLMLGFVDWLIFQGAAAKYTGQSDYLRANFWHLLAIRLVCLVMSFGGFWVLAPQFFVQFSDEGIHWLGLRGYILIKWSKVKAVSSSHYSGNPIIIVKLQRYRELRMLHLVLRSPRSVISFIESKIAQV